MFAVICWAISFIRAVEALYNIGQRVDEQRSYLVNNVKVGKLGLEDRKTLGDFVQKNGLLDEAECSYKRAKGTCAHENVRILVVFFVVFWLEKLSKFSSLSFSPTLRE